MIRIKNEQKPAGQAAACQAELPRTLSRMHHPEVAGFIGYTRGLGHLQLLRPGSAQFFGYRLAPKEKAGHFT
jgi:hypothetical protein